jgi:hypothetical protein
VNARAAVLLVLFCAAACGPQEREEQLRPAPPPQGSAAPAEVQARYVDLDVGNLLDVSRGASILSRTAELNLEQSAIHAIDGMATTRWVSPPGDANQTLVAALGAPGRIDRLGIATTRFAAQIPAAVRFEASMDGASWREAFVFRPAAKEGRQVQDVPPFDARYLRVSTVEPKDEESTLLSVIALGSETEAPAVPSFDGCWTINGAQSRLAQEGRRIRGVIGGEQPTAIDGAVDGRVARVMWVRGPMWGYAAMTLAPEAKALSAVTFHQEILIGNAGGAWFGEPCNSPLQLNAAGPLTFLARSGRWSMFGLAFDAAGRLDESASAATIDAALAAIASAPREQRFRIVSREYREATPEANRERSATRLASLQKTFERRGVGADRVEFTAAGSESSSIEGNFAVMRLLASRIDLEIVQ